MDGGRYLDGSARSLVAADMLSFARALAPETAMHDAVPLVLPEMLLLAEDPKPDAPSMLANSLWYKYRTSPDWGWKVWDNAVASLRQVPLMTDDTLKRHMVALQYAQFLLHIDRHLPAGIDEQVLRWFLGTGKNEILALTVDAWNAFTIVLLFLGAHGALPSTTILRGLVYPAWAQLANVVSEQAQSLATYIQSANALFDSPILRSEPQISSTLSNTLLDIRRFYTRRQDAFGELHFGFLAAEMPILVSIEHNSFVPQHLRDMAQVLRGLRATYPVGIYREPLVNALKVILSDSGEGLSGTDANTLLNDRILSVLSPWRLAATAVQLQFGLRQLGRAMANDSTRQAASASLDKMTSVLFHHSIAYEEACFIAEMVKEIDSAVAEKFVNNGMESLGAILLHPSTPAVLDNLVGRIDQSMLTSADSVTSKRLTQNLLFVARLVQFNLGFGGSWTTAVREQHEMLSSIFFRLALMHGSGSSDLDSVAYPLFIDTLYFVIDELHSQSKTSTTDLFKYNPNMSENELSKDIPTGYCRQLFTLLPQPPPDKVVTDLMHALVIYLVT
ncbi:hypothetical protein JVU11DRAFT_12480 [Chiua virens]|nr:hypothetical protein JVU11DRAFT_12480 [Chiua virens]